MQIISSIIHLIIGFIIGAFVFSQIVFPIIYSVPKSTLKVLRGELRLKIIFMHLMAPIIWLIIISIIVFISKLILPGVYNLITNNNFISGWSFSFIFVISSLFTKKGREDLKKDYDDFAINYKKHNL